MYVNKRLPHAAGIYSGGLSRATREIAKPKFEECERGKFFSWRADTEERGWGWWVRKEDEECGLSESRLYLRGSA